MASPFDSPTFGQDGSFRLDKPVGSVSISPCGRDVALASRQGLHIIDLDSPWSPPRHLPHHTPWEVADVQWSPFAIRDYWVVSTSNQKALVWNLAIANVQSSVEFVLHAHSRAITDINFSAHHPDVLATCAVDSFVHCWDLRHPARPAMTFCDWFAGATQVKWNRQDSHVLASSHDRILRIWDDRKGAYPLRSIEAHATKIYGVDWNRLDANKVVTCSLDRTIKFWNIHKDFDQPDSTLNTGFPVWRARHTPVGSGLLAMPQRGDQDLHLYDVRQVEHQLDQNSVIAAIHRFEGHISQVKEFLWRPRGNVTESMDDRDFQLVSWGADRILRLHKIGEELLRSIGYQKGMEIKRKMNFTRKNAIYKTYRENAPHCTDNMAGMMPDSLPDQLGPSGIGPTSALGMTRSPLPFLGGYGNQGSLNSAISRQSRAQNEMDPIAWMRGVKIGKRETSSAEMNHSISSVLSPSTRMEPTWDTYESLGEEITHVGEKFAKVTFEEIDMQYRSVLVFLSGPWGIERSSSFFKCRIKFPTTYPDHEALTIHPEKTASIADEVMSRICSDVAVVTKSFVAQRRSSLEHVLRYLLGEHSLGEILLGLKKREDGADLESDQDSKLSSSDEEDEALPKCANREIDLMEASDPSITAGNANAFIPLPKACGALWADDGRLVCFFPPKQDTERLSLDFSLKSSDRSSRARQNIFDGFGRLQHRSWQKRTTSTLETIDSGDSNMETSCSSSSASSLDEIYPPHHHFMPSTVWHEDSYDVHPNLTTAESQRSIGDTGQGKPTTFGEYNFISIHDLKDLLPAKKHLAQSYVIRHGPRSCQFNAQVATERNDFESADVWLLISLILEDKVPLQILHHPREKEPIVVVPGRTLSHLKTKGSAKGLSFDATEARASPVRKAPIDWGRHPFGRGWLINSLFQHYEQLADIQMLAMLSIALSGQSERRELEGQTWWQPKTENSIRSENLRFRKYLSPDYSSKATLTSQVESSGFKMSTEIDYQSVYSGPLSSSLSNGTPLSDMSASPTPPSTSRRSRTLFERREFQPISIFTSSEQLHQTQRSASNAGGLTAPLALPSSVTIPTISSLPQNSSKNRPSPAGSFTANAPSNAAWASAGTFDVLSTLNEQSKPTIKLSMSDTSEGAQHASRQPIFKTVLKNQGQFDYDGCADVALLESKNEWRYRIYRDAYAHLLHIWEMPLSRLEVLKCNFSSTSKSAWPNMPVVPSSATSRNDRTTALETLSPNIVDRDVVFKSHCRSCSTLQPLGRKMQRCSICSAKQDPLVCLLCNSFIRGLCSPCFNCGHALHTSCREILVSTSDQEDSLLSECISGCGCICTEHSVIAVDPSYPVEPLAKPAYRNTSPAATVIADEVKSEREPLRMEGGEGEDVAYESLARNLRPRLQVRKTASQIWRGRKGNR